MKIHTMKSLDALIRDDMWTFQEEFRALDRTRKELGIELVFLKKPVKLTWVQTFFRVQRLVVHGLADKAVNESMMRLVENKAI